MVVDAGTASEHRSRPLERMIARWIARRPLRLPMTILVGVSGAAGLVASVALLAAGVGAMWLRYPAAALVAYGVFLLGLRCWVGRLQARGQGVRTRSRRLELVDLVPTPDVPIEVGESRGSSEPDFDGFGGGEFGGGGAGGTFELGGEPATATTESVPSADGNGGVGILDMLGLDEAWPLAVALALAGAVLLTSVYFVWVAPVLVTELVVEGVAVGLAYRQARTVVDTGWVPASVRRTWIAAVGLVASVALVGAAATWVRPDADSIGDLFRPPAIRH